VTRRCRLAILASHPIQYFTPIYRRLAMRPALDIEVLYCHDYGVHPRYDKQFQRDVVWDTDQLAGYRYRFLRSISPIADAFNPLHAINPGSFTHLLRGFDALWVNGYVYPSNWMAAAAAKMRGTKLLVRSDFRLYRRKPRRWFHGARDVILRRWIRASDGLLYVGKANREAYEYYGARADQLFFTPHSVDVDRIEARSREARRDLPGLRRKYAVPLDKTIVQFVGKLTVQKHVTRMLDIAARLPDVHVMIVGTGPLESLLRDDATRQGIQNISFHGFVNQSSIAEVYAAGDVFVLPAEGEAWGLAVNEAMAAGVVPVISSEVGAAPDLITDGETGFVFEFGDWDAMIAHVARLTRDPALRARASEAARERSRLYCYDNAVQGIVDCLVALNVYRAPVEATSPRMYAHVRH
jgi:glycosyltransferase involved in cell wall biosynthesis